MVLLRCDLDRWLYGLGGIWIRSGDVLDGTFCKGLESLDILVVK